MYLYATNTTLQDTAPANVCWDAVDGSKANNGGGNYLCTTGCFLYNLTVDTTPPIVALSFDPCDTLAVTVTDIRPLDEGIYSVWLDTSFRTVNLSPFSEIDSGAQSLSFPLQIINRDRSATGHLSAFDVYGERSSIGPIQALHTTSFDFAAYRENLAMKASGIVNTPTSVTFNVPVYLDSTTDTFALGRKGIYAFTFTIQITGSNLLSFIGTAPSTSPALSAWNISSTAGPLPNSYTIKGQAPTINATLTDAQATDTLLYLTFTGAKSTDVEEAQISVDSDDCGNYVIYNEGINTTALDSSHNWSATVPPPAGLMNGGTVIPLWTSCTLPSSATTRGIIPQSFP